MKPKFRVAGVLAYEDIRHIFKLFNIYEGSGYGREICAMFESTDSEVVATLTLQQQPRKPAQRGKHK